MARKSTKNEIFDFVKDIVDGDDDKSSKRNVKIPKSKSKRTTFFVFVLFFVCSRELFQIGKPNDNHSFLKLLYWTGRWVSSCPFWASCILINVIFPKQWIVFPSSLQSRHIVDRDGDV